MESPRADDEILEQPTRQADKAVIPDRGHGSGSPASPVGGQFDREMQGFFHALADRIHETWPDPAGLGPPVSDSMDATRRAAACSSLLNAGSAATQAIQLTREGKNGA